MEKDSDEADSAIERSALFLLQDGMSESVNPFHLKRHSTFTVRTCVQGFVRMKCLTLSLLILVCLPGRSPSHFRSFCYTASAPYAELSLVQRESAQSSLAQLLRNSLLYCSLAHLKRCVYTLFIIYSLKLKSIYIKNHLFK